MAISARGHAGLRAGAASLWIVLRRPPEAGLGCILLAIASLWLAVPTFGLLAGETTLSSLDRTLSNDAAVPINIPL